MCNNNPRFNSHHSNRLELRFMYLVLAMLAMLVLKINVPERSRVRQTFSKQVTDFLALLAQLTDANLVPELDPNAEEHQHPEDASMEDFSDEDPAYTPPTPIDHPTKDDPAEPGSDDYEDRLMDAAV